MQRLHLIANPTLPNDLRWEDPWTARWGEIPIYILSQEGYRLRVRIGEILVELTWEMPQHSYLRRVKPPVRHHAAAMELRAPMPGLIREVRLSIGQVVTPHTPAIVLEAMKMENLLLAPAAGVVAEIAVAPGQAVEKGALLLRLKPEHAD